MLEYFGLKTEAKVIYLAIRQILRSGIGTRDLHLDVEYGCDQVGDVIAHLVSEADLDRMNDVKIKLHASTII